MIVVADSGSTKADWAFLKSGKITRQLSTAGFNPVLHDEARISAELVKRFEGLGAELADVQEVVFYGSGCWDEKRANVIVRAIQPFFPAAKIVVEHDLLGAARAACGKEPGIACILGTGSNSCLYDGHDIVDNVTNLGYLLGDEGSGSHMGKMLIRAYFYRELPPELEREMSLLFPGGKMDILDKIYGISPPNTYLASFSTWIGERISHPWLQEMVERSFGKFVDRQVMKYEGYSELPINFVGSLAFHFRDQLAHCLEARGLRLGRIAPKPIEQLAAFHQSN